MKTLEHWKSFLQIDKLALDDCLIEQPEVYYHVSEGVTLAVEARDAAKLDLDELMAKKDQEIRTKAAVDEEKLTETAIQNKLRGLPEIQEAQQDLLTTRKAADDWLALKEAFQQRSFMLRELVALTIAQRGDLALANGSNQARAVLADDNKARADKLRRERRQGQ